MSSICSFLQRGFSLAAETVVMTDKSFCCRSSSNYFRMIVGSASSPEDKQATHGNGPIA